MRNAPDQPGGMVQPLMGFVREEDLFRRRREQAGLLPDPALGAVVDEVEMNPDETLFRRQGGDFVAWYEFRLAIR
ncbi:hypothetical protein D3C86_2079820 [compost metagenome]